MYRHVGFCLVFELIHLDYYYIHNQDDALLHFKMSGLPLNFKFKATLELISNYTSYFAQETLSTEKVKLKVKW